MYKTEKGKAINFIRNIAFPFLCLKVKLIIRTYKLYTYVDKEDFE